jgi:hypothetical protein
MVVIAAWKRRFTMGDFPLIGRHPIEEWRDDLR